MKKTKIIGLALTTLFISNTSFADDRVVTKDYTVLTKLYDGKIHLDECAIKAKTILEGKSIQRRDDRQRRRREKGRAIYKGRRR
jgi:hypothetical protein